MRTKSKYYDDDDPNRPGHPEFDINNRKPVTPKLVYDVFISLVGDDVDRFFPVYENIYSWFVLHNGDPVSLEMRLQKSLTGIDDYDAQCQIEVRVDGRIEDLDVAFEQFASIHNVEVRVCQGNTLLYVFNEHPVRY